MYLAYLLDILFFRMEFTQDLSQFEYSKLFGWKYLICSFQIKAHLSFKCSILVIVSFIQMVSTITNGYTAKSTKNLPIGSIYMQSSR